MIKKKRKDVWFNSKKAKPCKREYYVCSCGNTFPVNWKDEQSYYHNTITKLSQ